MCFRLFYAGAVEGQMPEILSMIQVNKMTPAPAVLVVVRITFTIFSGFFIFIILSYGRPKYLKKSNFKSDGPFALTLNSLINKARLFGS